MRKALFWVHLIAALSAGLVIAIMSFTGVLLMYEKQMVRWADGYTVTPPSPLTRVSVEALLQKAQVERPKGTIATITVLADPSAPANVSFGRDGSLFLNPYNGAVLGQGSKETRAFFRSVTDWHRWLARDGEDRATGRAITGASNLLFLFVVLTGLVIWWPKSWTPAAFKSIVLFRGGLSAKARDFNWHNVIGFWSAIPLFFVVLSGVVISYPWAGDLVYRVTGNEPPPRSGGPAPSGPGAPELNVSGLDVLWTRATQEEPAWRTMSFRLPTAADAPVVFSIDTSSGAARPDKRSSLTLNRATGEIVKFEPYESQNGGRQARTWLRFLHTGEALGISGQTIAGIASAGSLVLAWTGLALSWRRFKAWRSRRAKSRNIDAILVTPAGTSA